MVQEKDTVGTNVQPSLTEMFAHFIQRQTEAAEAGLHAAEIGAVVPFEAAPVQPVDARLAWEEARAAVSASERCALSAPPEWANLVQSQEPVAALAFALGNFPQMVRDLHSLMQAQDLTTLRPGNARPAGSAGLVEWADQAARQQPVSKALIAIAALRLCKQFDLAEKRLRELRANLPAEEKAAIENEAAALAWHQGRAEEAAALWNAQEPSVPVLFNRGMAALFLGRSAEARPWLTKAVAQLPEDSAWHHLGQLYLALAEMR